jgi:hypothetical protein
MRALARLSSRFRERSRAAGNNSGQGHEGKR